MQRDSPFSQISDTTFLDEGHQHMAQFFDQDDLASVASVRTIGVGNGSRCTRNGVSLFPSLHVPRHLPAL